MKIKNIYDKVIDDIELLNFDENIIVALTGMLPDELQNFFERLEDLEDPKNQLIVKDAYILKLIFGTPERHWFDLNKKYRKIYSEKYSDKNI